MERIQQVMMELFRRAYSPGREISAGQLAQMGEEAGLTFTDAVQGIIQLAKAGKIYAPGGQLGYGGVLAPSQEEADRIQKAKIDRAVSNILGSEPPSEQDSH